MAILKTANARGKYYEIHAKDDVISYVLDARKCGRFSGGSGVDPKDPAASMMAVSERFGKTNGVQLRHFIISFSPVELDNPTVCNEIGQRLMAFFAYEYQVIYAVHADREHLHIHMVINSVSYVDGHRYYGTRVEFAKLKHYLRRLLAEYGIQRVEYVSARGQGSTCPNTETHPH